MTAQPETTHNAREILIARGRAIVSVQGRSLFPPLRSGVRVEVQKAAWDELEPGDLIVYDNTEVLICHRLLRKSGRLLIVKGDTNLLADPPVLWAQTLGRVTRFIDADLRLHALDALAYRRRAARMARWSYLLAFGYQARKRLDRWLWRTRGIEWES